MSKEITKQLKRAQATRRQAVSDRDKAIKERNEAVAAMIEMEDALEAFAAAYGGTPEEAKEKIVSAWDEIRSEQSAIKGDLSGLEQYSARLDQEASRLHQIKHDIDVAKDEIATQAEVLKEREIVVAEREEAVAARENSASIKPLRRRLKKKTDEIAEEKRKNAILFKECERLTTEVTTYFRKSKSAEEALEHLCNRFNVSVMLDIYKGHPMWISNGCSVQIPDAGMILEFIGEKIEVSPEHFAGETHVAFELFAEVINDKIKPTRWRVGLHEQQIALFARGLYKILDTELIPPPTQDDDTGGDETSGIASTEPPATHNASDSTPDSAHSARKSTTPPPATNTTQTPRKQPENNSSDE